MLFRCLISLSVGLLMRQAVAISFENSVLWSTKAIWYLGDHWLNRITGIHRSGLSGYCDIAGKDAVVIVGLYAVDSEEHASGPAI